MHYAAAHRHRGYRVLLLTLFTLLVLLLGACSEESIADKAFRETAKALGDMTVEEQIEALEEIAQRWPETRAARKARDELEAIKEQQEAETHGKALLAWDTVRKVGRAAEQYKRRYGRYPADLDAMIPDYLDGRVIDPWGNEVIYRKTEAGYQAVSYGEDGLPGGTDLAKDLLVDTSQLKGD